MKGKLMKTLEKERHNMVELSARDKLMKEILEIKEKRSLERMNKIFAKKELEVKEKLGEKRALINQMETGFINHLEDLAYKYFGIDRQRMVKMDHGQIAELDKMVAKKSRVGAILKIPLLILTDAAVIATAFLWITAIVLTAYGIGATAPKNAMGSVEIFFLGGFLWLVSSMLISMFAFLLFKLELGFSGWIREKIPQLRFLYLRKLLSKIHGKENAFPCKNIAEAIASGNERRFPCELLASKEISPELPLNKREMFVCEFLESTLFRRLTRS